MRRGAVIFKFLEGFRASSNYPRTVFPWVIALPIVASSASPAQQPSPPTNLTNIVSTSASAPGGSGTGPGPVTGPDNRYCNVGNIPNFGGNDGVAAAPIACYQTAESSTPSPGAVIQVSPSSNLQKAINGASCGDTIVLQAGQTYPAFTLPAKNCNPANYITIATSAVNSGLPPEGTRATPCNAGVASLPGRPPLNCTSTTNVMATIAGVASGSQIISSAVGANYYRLVGLEIADTEANGALGGYYDLVALNNTSYIIFDRCWIHGSPTGEDVKGVDFENSRYVAVIDSYISDIHSKISGYGADSSAIGSVTGTGPVKIVDDFLEAAGENILWGGGVSANNISDVEVRRNHMFKPFTWWNLSPTYFGTAFVVKNLFESKSGIRQLVEGNILEDNWHQSQNGTAVLLDPRNEYGGCSVCTVHDIIFRYNIVRHAVNALSLSVTYATTCPGEAGNGTGDCKYLSGALYDLSIHDNLLDDINQPTYWPDDCCTDGLLFQLQIGEPTNWPQNILIAHNTGFPVGSGDVNVILQGPPQVIANFSFLNNLMTTGTYGFHPVLPGYGQPGCGVTTTGSGMLSALKGCMGNTWSAVGNVFADSATKTTGPFPGAPLPSGNFQAANAAAVGFVNFDNGNGGDYELLPSSPYINAASDGTNPGANIPSIQTATAGVL